MSNLSRKQREIAERHNRFLDIGRALLHENGFHHLNMDRVAELAEYSKGTLYQHFNCKEELLGQLCTNALQSLYALVLRESKRPGSHRERVLAFFVAYDVFQNQSVDDVRMMQNFHTDQVLEKLSPSTRDRYSALQRDIFNLIKQIVDDAIAAGDLPIRGLNSADIAFALWSMAQGAASIRSYNLSLDETSMNSSCVAIVEMVERMLDGLGWTPLSDTTKFDVEKTMIDRS